MANLRKWSTSASGNATVAGGANTISFAEGQSPGSVNNSAREMMAQVRSIYTPGEWGWVEHSATVSVASQTTFKLTGDQRTNFSANRRVRLKSGSSTRYASIVSSSFTTETTITVTVDSGSLSASHSLVALSMYDGNNLPQFVTSASASAMIAAVAVAASTTEALAGTSTTKFVTPDALHALFEAGSDNTGGATISIGDGAYHNLITSTTAITAFSFLTGFVGRTFRVRFDTARTLTHNATSLILTPSGGRNITTAQGDIAQFRSLGSGNVICEWYTPADGRPIVGALTLGTEQATTSGTSIDFTGIPTWARRITIMFRGVSTSGSSNVQVQIGDSGGVEATGYISTVTDESAAAGNSTTGFISVLSGAADVLSGTVTLCHMGSNAWVSSGNLKSSTSKMYQSTGDKALSDVLDRVRITTVGGANTFDAGSINIMYE